MKPFQQTAVLVTTGVYSRSRNPMYLGFVLIMLGLALLLGSVGPLVIVFILPGLLNAMYIRSEEAMLRARFGDQWLAYQGSVRKWL